MSGLGTGKGLVRHARWWLSRRSDKSKITRRLEVTCQTIQKEMFEQILGVAQDQIWWVRNQRWMLNDVVIGGTGNGGVTSLGERRLKCSMVGSWSARVYCWAPIEVNSRCGKGRVD